MSQSALLVGLLAAGFLMYLAAKGRLTTYTGVLWGPAPKDNSGGSNSGGGKSDTEKAAKTAATVAKYAPIFL